jgi:hypothetical protein
MASKQTVHMNQGQGETSYARNSSIQVYISSLILINSSESMADCPLTFSFSKLFHQRFVSRKNNYYFLKEENTSYY